MTATLNAPPGPVSAVQRMDAAFVLGYNDLPAARIVEVQRYLTDVIAQRGFPLHLNSLWNALFYGWDLAEGGYPDEALNLEVLAEVQMAERSEALPVGAFAFVTTGGPDIIGEVVAKFGAVEGVAVGDVPGELAGRAAEATVLRERVIVDAAALPAWSDVQDRQLARLRRHARWVDELGHVVYDADYATAEAADRSDVDFYLDWLLTNRRAGLLDWAFIGGTADMDEGDVDAAVAATFDTVTRLLEATPGLVRFGDWWWLEDAYREQVGDDSGRHRLGAQELASLWQIVRSTYGGRLRWRAVALELAELASHRWSAEDRAEVLTGTGFVRSVVVTNRYLADRVRTDALDGIVSSGDTPVHVRVDDTWQAGGLWRTEVVDGPAWYHRIAPDVALGLGSGVALAPPVAEPAVPDDEIAVPAPVVDDRVVEVVEVERTWTLHLSAAHHAAGTLTVPLEVARLLTDGPVTVRLYHDARTDGVPDAEVGVHRASLRDDTVEGIVWPGRLLAGTEIACRVVRGSRVIDAESRLLDVPVDIDGLIMRHRHDRRVLERVAGRSVVATLRRSVAATLRTLIGSDAALDDSGARRVHVATLTEAVLGREARADASCLSRILDALDSLGVRRDDLSVVVAPGSPLPAAGPRSPAPLSAARKAELAAAVRTERRMTVRRLAPGEQPADRAAYQQARVASGEQAVLPEELDSGWTYEASSYRSAAIDGDIMRRIGPVMSYEDDF